MKKYKFLVFTDHSGHSQHNSLYALMRTLVQHPNCAQIDVASRGNAANSPFFTEEKLTALYAVEVTSDFAFQANGAQFMQTKRQVSVADYDVIFMRLPRPVSDSFLDFVATIGKDKVLINHPKGIKNTSSKAFLVNFPEVCPPIRLCYQVEEIRDFVAQQETVLKPLKEYGGKGILRIKNGEVIDGEETYKLDEFLENNKAYIEAEGYLAMQFLKNVSQGDKRILVVNGQLLAASLRLPAEDNWLCNVAQGGKSVPAEADADERAIIERISPRLLAEGIVIFGADTLVNDEGKRILSEVNTLSIGGFPQAEKQSGRPILQQTIQGIIDYVRQSRND